MLNEKNNFVYENHLGQRFDGMANGMYLNHSNILDYSWYYDVINRRISRFYRPVTTRKLPIVVIGKTDAEAMTAKNRLLEIVEADIQAMIPGKIYVGDYYSTGFITASTKSKYLFSKRYCNIDLEFTSSEPAWYRDVTHVFSLQKNAEQDAQKDSFFMFNDRKLPKLPEWDKEAYPYAFITHKGTITSSGAKYMYALWVVSGVEYGSTSSGTRYISLSEIEYKRWIISANFDGTINSDEWTLSGTTSYTESFKGIKWSNFDVMNEDSTVFLASSAPVPVYDNVGYGVNYPYDYPYDYAATSNKNREIVCDTVTSSKIKIRIYGEATNPAIMIGDHSYSVNGMIKQGETLLVDGVNKTITLTTATGAKVNWFDKRNRESYIFEPMLPGINNVRYNGTFGFDITIVEERSEPKWT